MKQYIVQGNDSKDEILYVVKSKGANDAFQKVADLMGCHLVTLGVERGQPRHFLCCMDLTADQVGDRIDMNALGEHGRGVYEVTVRELVENVNLA